MLARLCLVIVILNSVSWFVALFYWFIKEVYQCVQKGHYGYILGAIFIFFFLGIFLISSLVLSMHYWSTHV